MGAGDNTKQEQEATAAQSPVAEVTQRWLTQSRVGGGDVPPEERGDCVQACLASILGLPLGALENHYGDGWWDRLCGDVQRFGYTLALIDMDYDPPAAAYWIATLPSLNLGTESDGNPAMHCVVARGYELIHDPSLGTRYDNASWGAAWKELTVAEGWVLVPVDPASATSPKRGSA